MQYLVWAVKTIFLKSWIEVEFVRLIKLKCVIRCYMLDAVSV